MPLVVYADSMAANNRFKVRIEYRPDSYGIQVLEVRMLIQKNTAGVVLDDSRYRTRYACGQHGVALMKAQIALAASEKVEEIMRLLEQQGVKNEG